MNEFMDIEFLASFAGISVAVGVIVQFTKSLIIREIGSSAVRIYAFILALILSFIFINTGYTISEVVLTVINSIIITMTVLGGYEVITDPFADK